MALEQPILWLGLAGFDSRQTARIQQFLLAQPEAFPSWRLSRFGEADAWCVNGAHVRVAPGGLLHMQPPADHGGEPLHLNLEEVDRPIAFATPLASEDFEPMHVFDPEDARSVGEVLQHFDHWYRPIRAQFHLGRQVAEREHSLGGGVYHVTARATLLAVVDVDNWRTGFLTTAQDVDYSQATWHKRPAAANDIPQQFATLSLTELMWSYAQRAPRNVLPERYRNSLIYFRRAPRLPWRVLTDAQLLILRELSIGPARFERLMLDTGQDEARLARDLASLYFAGSITSTRSSAASSAADFAVPPEAGLGAPRPSLRSPTNGFQVQQENSDHTVPAPLGRR